MAAGFGAHARFGHRATPLGNRGTVDAYDSRAERSPGSPPLRLGDTVLNASYGEVHGFSFEFSEEVANQRLLAVFLGAGSRTDVDGGRLDGRRRTARGSP